MEPMMLETASNMDKAPIRDDVTSVASTFFKLSETTPNATVDEQLIPFTEVTVAIVASFLIIFLVFGFFANLLTMLVIVTSKSLIKNVFNLFILSLCFADMISSTVSWINLYRRTWGFDEFKLPTFFCWLYWGADMWTSYVTSQHILSFAILRLISVWKPFFFNKITHFYAKVWIITIWFVAFGCGFVPFALFSEAKTPDRRDRSSPTARWPSCTQSNKTLTEYREYIHYAYPIFFYIPLVAIAVVSVLIGIAILTRRSRQQKYLGRRQDLSRLAKTKKKEKQAIIQLALIVGSFMLGYLPFTIFEFWTLYSTDTSYDGWKTEWLFGTVQYMCLRFSECLNPVFYNLASSKLRKETFCFFRNLKSKKTAYSTRSVRSSNPSGLVI